MGYVDTSAFIPLLAAEPTSSACAEFWRTADAVVSCRIVYAEAAAALAGIERSGRLTAVGHRRARATMDALYAEFEIVDVDEDLVRRAADLAYRLRLRGYDAVHCAAAAQLDAPDLVAASADQQLLAAWQELRIATFDPATPT
jgi:predicted nucleic acid-binding protein